jgi:hypothetical protein
MIKRKKDRLLPVLLSVGHYITCPFSFRHYIACPLIFWSLYCLSFFVNDEKKKDRQYNDQKKKGQAI